MRTERLYYGDPYARQFRARVLERRELAGKMGLVLDRTLFYPTAGGQPHDKGTLGGLPVLDVFEDGEAVVHVVPARPEAVELEGILDWARRFDHMQQHTGQHILSQAFVRRLDAETVSFHLSEQTGTVDVALVGLTPDQLAAVEDTANEVIYADTPVRAGFVAPERLADLPLRKPPKVAANVRIVEVAGFDWSPCGGTHCRAAGEVGIIKILRCERRGADTRVEFACGRRALLHYRRQNELLSALGSAFSAGADEAVALALRGLEEAKAREKELLALRDRLLDYEAAERLAAAPRVGEVALVAEVFVDRKVDELKRLALKLTAGERVVALLGTQGRKGQLVFACSPGAGVDASALLREAAAKVGGRGGGTASLAQGGAADPARIADAVALAREQVAARLTAR